MNPYEPPQSELPNLKSPKRSPLWLVFIVGLLLLLYLVVIVLIKFNA